MNREYSLSLIALLKGIVYDYQKETWENLLRYEPDVKKYFLPVGLQLYLNKSEGFAYLYQKEWEAEETALPKLVEKRQLNFFTSLSLLLRKYLLEQDAQGGAVRSIISEQEIINRAKVFLPKAPDEAKQQEKIVATINKVIEIGFLRKLEDNQRNYELHSRIIKGFVNADVVDEALKKLQAYASEKQVTE